MVESQKGCPLNTIFIVTVIFLMAKLKPLSVRKLIPLLSTLLSTYLNPSLQNYQKEKLLKLLQIRKKVKQIPVYRNEVRADCILLC